MFVLGIDNSPLPPETISILLTLGIIFILFVLLVSFLKRYRRCPSNKILVIYGKTGSGASKCVHGGAAFIWPLFQAYDYLDLEQFVVPIDLSNALSQENIRVTVPTSVTAAISNQRGIMENAAVRLLGLTTQQIQTQAQDIIIGQMRAVIATMKIEDINRDRQSFMAKVNEAVAVELEKIGLAVINVNIRDIEDESGYIKAIGRKAAAEAINQANVDVAEQEKSGQTGVAQRNRDQRVAVAAAIADAEIGEATAARNKRQQVAKLDAEAVNAETAANAQKAAYRASQKVAEEEARNKGESAAKQADGAIRVAQEQAQKNAEDARAIREQSRLNAEIVVPAEAEKKRIVIAAEAQKEQTITVAQGQKEQSIQVAQGQAQAMLAKMTAEGQGVQAVLDGKATGYRNLVQSAGDGQTATALLLIEKLLEISNVQAKAISELPIEKIIIWDGGGNGDGGLAGLGKRIMGALPPMHELARQVGLDLPEFLGKVGKGTADGTRGNGGNQTPPAAGPVAATAAPTVAATGPTTIVKPKQ
jgi:flotillin